MRLVFSSSQRQLEDFLQHSRDFPFMKMTFYVFFLNFLVRCPRELCKLVRPIDRKTTARNDG